MTAFEDQINKFEECKNCFRSDCYRCKNSYVNLDLCIIALQEKAERSKGCEWCREFKDIELSGFTIHGTMRTTVNYCPRCGKRLV